MYVGIDIGRSAVKAVGPRTTWVGPTGLLVGRLTRGPIALLETEEAAQTEETEDVTIETAGRTWTLTDWGGATYDLSPHKTREGTAIALLGALGALLIAEKATEGEDAIIVATGLPAALMEPDAQPLGRLVIGLVREGVTVRWKGRTVRIPRRLRLLVYAEGDGIYEAARREGLAGTESLVLDMGHVTTNIVEYRRGGERARAFSLPKGGADVFRGFGNALARRGGPLMSYGQIHWLVPQMFAGLITRIDLGDGREADPREIFREAARDFFIRDLWPEVQAILGNYAAFGNVVIAGGGAEIFPVGEVLPQARVMPEPRLAQARGYAMLAARYAEERTRT
jgi:hypothetical protein